jgi:chromosomal replication initiation ATPase DnaA
MVQQAQQMSAWVIPGIRSATPLSFDDVVKIVTGYYGMTVEEITKINRKRERVTARAILTWFLIKETRYTLKSIGQYFGQDHTTVLYHRDKIQGFIEIKDHQTLRDLAAIEILINNH